MPELPEVETIVRELRPKITGRLVSGMIIKPKAQTHLLQSAPEVFYEHTIGETVSSVVRQGKYILMPLANKNVIVFHLGMTGKLLLKEAPNQCLEERLGSIGTHTHFLMELTDQSGSNGPELELMFDDVRLFGNIWLDVGSDDIYNLDIPGLRDLGPDALTISLSDFEKLAESKRAIKASLLDQSKIAGIGNIYADEALFLAKIHPATKGHLLTPEQLGKLWLAVKSILKQGIKYRGSSTSD